MTAGDAVVVQIIHFGVGGGGPGDGPSGLRIAVTGVVGSVAYNATATLGVAALVRPLAAGGIMAPAIAAAALPSALLMVTAGGRLHRQAGTVLVAGYGALVTAVLVR